jgi:hypothetical protein
MAIANDTFTRSVSNGWGTADSGDAYALTGTASKFSVDGTRGHQNASAGDSLEASLPLSVAQVDTQFKVRVPTVPVGGGLTVKMRLRQADANNKYSGRVVFAASGALSVGLERRVSGTLLTLVADQAVSTIAGLGTSGITFRAQTSAISTTTGQLILTKPSGVVSGDLMIAQVARRSTATLTVPSGWTLIRSDSDTDVTQNLSTYYKVAGGSEPSTYTWTWLGSGSLSAGGITAYTGQHATPIDASSGAVINTDTKVMAAPTITTTHTGSVLMLLYCFSGNATFSAPALMTQRYQAVSGTSSFVAVGAADQIAQAGVGPTGARGAGSSVSAHVVGSHGIAHLVILRTA